MQRNYLQRNIVRDFFTFVLYIKAVTENCGDSAKKFHQIFTGYGGCSSVG